jgi:hypothetical protein
VTVNDWTAAGALATACAAGLALVTIIVMWQQSINAEAARLREALRSVVSAAARVTKQMSDGGPLVVAGWLIADGLRQRQPDLDLATLKEAEGKDWALSAVVEGWSASPLASDLRHSLASLSNEREKLPGRLAVLGRAASVLEDIAADAYSIEQFMKLLSPKALDLFAKHYPLAHGDPGLQTRSLSTYLGSNTSGYVAAQYLDALSTLNVLMEELCGAFAGLSARRLVKYARARRLPKMGLSVTDAVRDELRALAFPEQHTSEIAAHWDELTTLLTPASAEKRLLTVGLRS